MHGCKCNNIFRESEQHSLKLLTSLYECQREMEKKRGMNMQNYIFHNEGTVTKVGL